MSEPADAGAAADTQADFDGPDQGAHERRVWRIEPALHGQRLDKALVAAVPEFSRNHLQGLVEQGRVSVDGTDARMASHRVRAGQTIAVELVPTAQSRAFRPEVLPLTVVHEDAHILVVDKAAGMVVHPAAGNWSGTLLNAVLAHHAGAGDLPRAGIVHRLDKDTSGLLVIGKTLAAMTALVRAIAAREVHREYLAIAHGRVQPQACTIDAPIGRDPRSRVRMAVVASGRAARTEVAVAGHAPQFSALRCVLHTGRTHQIRVHLASRGHPLVADPVYGGAPGLGLCRHALHAARLAFAHPVTGHPLAFDRAPPQDFATAWQVVMSSRN